MSFEKLSPLQQKHYAAATRRLGLPETESTHLPVEHPEGKTVVYSSDPLESDVPPKLVTVNTIQDMKKVLGFDSAKDLTEDEIPYPETDTEKTFFTKVNETQSREELEASLSEVQKAEIEKAAKAYVLGKSKKLKNYVPLINKLFFPVQIAVFASTEPKKIDGTILIISPNDKIVIWVYPSITFGPKGKIDQEANFLMETNILESSQGADGDLVINDIPPNYDTPATGGSSPGQPGQTGGGNPGIVKHYTTGDCGPYCAVPPTNGMPGIKGPNGGEAASGERGRAMNSLTMRITEKVTGKIIINAGGGNGQDGGKGGKGADGGLGGPAYSGPSPCGTSDKGQQGEGGTGGKGGDAGDGGDVGIITLLLANNIPEPNVELNPKAGGAGQVGIGGEGGNGIPPGKVGDHGNPGTPSPAPKVIIERLPPTS